MRPLKGLLAIVLLAAFACLVGACGSAGTGSTPTVDIPSPVTHLSISAADENGLVTVTGEAGFADAGSIVTVVNNSRSAVLFQHLIYRQAFAATSSTVTAGADGSFTTQVEAKAGDEIAVSFVTGGNGTSVSDTVPEKRFLIANTVDLQDVGVDAASGDAMVLGNDGTDGYVYVVDTTSGTVKQTIKLTGAGGAQRLATDPTTGDSLVIDSANIMAWVVDLSAGTATGAVVLAPVDAAFVPSGQFALITHADATAVSYYNTQTRLPDATAAAVGDAGETATSATAVDADTRGATNIFALLTRMSDDLMHVLSYEVGDNATLMQLTATELASVSNPDGLALFADGAEALITDTDNDRVLRVNLSTDQVTEIAVGDAPKGVVANDADNKAYVVNKDDRTVTVISLTDNSTSLSAQALGLSPKQLATVRGTSGSSLIVVNSGDGTIDVISTSTQ